MPPLVSVVVPLYNKASTIARCLESIRSQRCQDWECIVVNDGSTDGSAAAAATLSDPRIRIVDQKNQGPGAARNTGARHAQAPLLAFLDADDEWKAEYLEHHLHILASHGEIAASISGHRRTGTTTDTETLFATQGVTEGAWRLDPMAQPEEVKVATDFMHSGSVVVRRPVFEKYGGYFEQRSTYGEDTHLWIQVVASQKLWRTTRPLMDYHVEDSCLGLGRKTVPPPWPMLLNPAPLLDACAPETRDALKRAFGFYAMIAANRLLATGRLAEANRLLRLNPAFRTLSSQRAKAERAKLRKARWLAPLRYLRTLRQK